MLTQPQAVTGKLPFAAVILKKITLLLEGTLVRVDDDRWTHLILRWLLKVLEDKFQDHHKR